ncbi:hypothetical protein [Aeoliella mucimassa]|uniref:Uncharacterized protein n=1 Tax=Aeoliella mucimassa TaxID=2527972 RepID=A0A518APZ4_9BACT|nr:hypothetical protein [Aeoliella mucimassa]QDU56794.1 hypothetical protein Pan181_30060 [Aeoliella mucimassa]
MSSKVQEILAKVEELTEAERAELVSSIMTAKPSHAAQTDEQPKRSVLDGFKERGMIGSITDAPPDWSTNPKYMEGFGSHEAE